MRKCPFCAEIVRGEAVVCRFCGKDLPPPGPSEEDLARGYRVVRRGLSAEEIEPVKRPAPPSP